MNIDRIRQIIIEEIVSLLSEAPADDKDKEKIAKEKDAIAQNKADLDQQKLDFNKQKLDYTQDKDREKDQEDQEKEKEGETGGEQKSDEPEVKPNISFNDQGEFYDDAFPELKNLVLVDGNLLTDDERRFVALAVQAAEGRFEKGFKKFLSKGRAGNVYGKDFSSEDIQKITKYCKEHELVR